MHMVRPPCPRKPRSATLPPGGPADRQRELYSAACHSINRNRLARGGSRRRLGGRSGRRLGLRRLRLRRRSDGRFLSWQKNVADAYTGVRLAMAARLGDSSCDGGSAEYTASSRGARPRRRGCACPQRGVGRCGVSSPLA